LSPAGKVQACVVVPIKPITETVTLIADADTLFAMHIS
jgi:hypothetical protein